MNKGCAMAHDRWLAKDLISQAISQGASITIKASSQGGPRLSATNRGTSEGSIKAWFEGSYNGEDETDIFVQISNLGSKTTSLDNQPIQTDPKADIKNIGQGSCIVKTTSNTKRTFELELKAYGTHTNSDGQNAYV